MYEVESSNRRCSAFAVVITMIVVLGAAATARGQSRIAEIHSFPSMGPITPVGSLTKAADGNLYGVTMLGGEHGRGAIYRLTLDGAVTTLYSFKGNAGGDFADGAFPAAGVIEGADGNFYGTCEIGGYSAGGTIFRVTPDGTRTTLFQFDLPNQPPGIGREPRGALVEATDGNFYGTTSTFGAVFRMTATGTVTSLHTFVNDGIGHPAAALIQALDGDLYGTTSTATSITPGFGAVFRLKLDGTFTVLHQFGNGSDGGYPGPLLQGSDGNFYGTTDLPPFFGNFGNVFRITPAGTLTVLHTFTDQSEGVTPTSLMEGSDGNLYGTMAAGGANGHGTIFRIATDGAFAVLHSFAGESGGDTPRGGLFEAAPGVFYGTTAAGGEHNLGDNSGTIYKISASGTLTTVHVFDVAGPDGSMPVGALLLATNGAFYGTTLAGGKTGRGAVFRTTPETSDSLTLVHSFTGDDGSAPAAGIIEASDGNFYGTTLFGGRSNRGVVYKMGPDGAVTVLHAFAGGFDGALPSSALLESGGSFLGTTMSGGPFGRGTVFRMGADGSVTVLHWFHGGLDGSTPVAGLIRGTDGNFYGTTLTGGFFGRGTIYRMTPSGEVTVLHALTGLEGEFPYAAVMQAADGNFYGTGSAGGLWNRGTLFRMTPTGAVKVLHAFTGAADGGTPLAPLIQSEDGPLFGTTLAGGAHDRGVIFRMDSPGLLLALHEFNGIDGDRPAAPLVQSASGAWFYGVTSTGGRMNERGGVLFRMFNSQCVDRLDVSYAGGALNLGFTLQAPYAATWSVWLKISTADINLWSVRIEDSSPHSFNVPLVGFPKIGLVTVATAVSDSIGTLCGDLTIVNAR